MLAAGGRPIYTEYPGVDHNSWTQTYDSRYVWDWMFAQHR
jgi:predicted peptidase